jgi:hypothetical protein
MGCKSTEKRGRKPGSHALQAKSTQNLTAKFACKEFGVSCPYILI